MVKYSLIAPKRAAYCALMVAGISFVPVYAQAQTAGSQTSALAGTAIVSDTGEVDMNGMSQNLVSTSTLATYDSTSTASLKAVAYSWFKPQTFSEQMTYFCKWESGQNYDQGLSYGDGYHAMGYFQFDNRYDLGSFLKAVYEYNPTKYAALRVLRDRYNWNVSGTTRANGAFTQLGNDLNYAWHSCYKADPTEFSGLQNSWAYNKYYSASDGVRLSLKAMGFDIDSRPDCIKGLVWGMGNLFGKGGGAYYIRQGKYIGANWFFKQAGITNSMSDQEVVTRLCDAVINNVSSRYPTQPQYWNGWINRYKDEKAAYLKFLQDSWTATGVTTSTNLLMVGETLTYSANVTGRISGATYNYVWKRTGAWVEGQWGSTVYNTGKTTTATSGTFTPTEPGTYELFVDVIDGSGKKVTVATSKNITVSPKWSITAINTSASTISIPDTLTYSAQTTGLSGTGVSYNYIWSRNGSTASGQWGSTVNATGKTTTATSSTLKPTQAGTYTLTVEVTDANGIKRSLSKQVTVNTWALIGVTAPKTIHLGESITYRANVSNAPSVMSYNYVWLDALYWGQQTAWDSTVKRTGKMTQDGSYTFTPTKAGTYTLYVDAKDASGKSVTAGTTVEVLPAEPTTVAVSATSPQVGQTITFKVANSNVFDSNYRFNYVWLDATYWGRETEWDSTLKSTGQLTSAKSASLTIKHGGTYTMYIDVWYKNQFMGTIGKTITVRDWTVSPITLNQSSYKVGQEVIYRARPSYALAGAQYNYVWLYGTNWGKNNPWSSNVKETGKPTSATQGTFTPTQPGTYTLYVDVYDAYGTKRTVGTTITVS